MRYNVKTSKKRCFLRGIASVFNMSGGGAIELPGIPCGVQRHLVEVADDMSRVVAVRRVVAERMGVGIYQGVGGGRRVGVSVCRIGDVRRPLS